MGWQYRCFVLWARRGVVIRGGRLIDHLPFGGPGEADSILREACELGWIQRRKYEPTVELRFFGVGGQEGARPLEHGTYLCEYAWEVMPGAPVWTEEAERALIPPTAEERASVKRQLDAICLEWVEHTKRQRDAAIVEVAHRVLDTACARSIAAPRQGISRTKRASATKGKK